jgi:hypothetical protein
LSVCGVKDIGHIEKHATELLVNEPNFLSVIAIGKHERYKFPGNFFKILAELI